MKENKKIKVLDLFCGAGGFSEGFRQAGYEIVCGIDNDAEALATYGANFPGSKALKLNLEDPKYSKNDSLSEILKIKIDIIIGGPPCQGMSIAGKRLAEDPRNKLYKAYLHLIEKVKPIAVVVENVPTILSHNNGAVAKAIIQDFSGLGYKVSTMTLNAADYGVPQNRRRTFFIGLRKGTAFKLPAPFTAFSPITCEMAISDLPLLENELGADSVSYVEAPKNDFQEMIRKSSNQLFNHWAVEHKEKTKQIIKLVPDGGNYKDLPGRFKNTRRVNIAWTRMNSQKPCFTIDAGHNHHFHYKANRVPTVRECARIQSFPDKFRFYGKKTSQFRQVGNAVPPLLAKVIAKSLREVI